MLEALQLDTAREAARIVAFLREQLAPGRLFAAGVGPVGGVDSALVAALGVQAVGPENVHGMILPLSRPPTPKAKLMRDGGRAIGHHL